MLSTEMLNNIIDSLTNGVILLNTDFEVILWNRWVEEKSGITLSEAKSKKIGNLFAEIKAKRFTQALHLSMKSSISSIITHLINGHILPLYMKNSAGEKEPLLHNIYINSIKGENDKKYILVYINDESIQAHREKLLIEKGRIEKELGEILGKEIEERRKIEGKLRLSAKVIESTMEGVIVTDPDGYIKMVNPSFSRIMGYSEKEVMHKKMNIFRSGAHNQEFYRQFWEELKVKEQWKGEFVDRKRNGEEIIIEASIVALKSDEGELTNYIDVFHDITERKKNEVLLKELSEKDPLTGIYNRRVLEDRYHIEYRRAQRSKTPISVILLDVDFFKEYNDHFGHQKGDICLRRIADQLLSSLKRPADFVARYGGEEFIVVLPDTPIKGAVQMAEGLRKAIENLKEPHANKLMNGYVTVSLGVSSVIPGEEDDRFDIIKNADKALYSAKKCGKNRVEVFGQ